MHTPLPPEELDILKKLAAPFKVIIDVGARDDIDYFDIFPEAEFHLFEVNPEWFKQLEEKVGNRKNVYLNNYGLGDVEGTFSYNHSSQSLDGGEAWSGETDLKLPVKTLDWYIKEKGITQIDFLKIDTEGYDYKVLRGGEEALKMTRYLQYEHWNDLEQFHDLLEKDFNMEYVGFRNVLCTRLHGIRGHI